MLGLEGGNAYKAPLLFNNRNFLKVGKSFSQQKGNSPALTSTAEAAGPAGEGY